MAIDKSHEYWIGTTPDDLKEYLLAYTTSDGTYQPEFFKQIQCHCGSDMFYLEKACEISKRFCSKCNDVTFICSSSDQWEEAESEEDVERFSCVECDSEEANIVIGFAFYDELQEFAAVKWLYVGVRCAKCGILGCFNDCKVGRDFAEVLKIV